MNERRRILLTLLLTFCFSPLAADAAENEPKTLREGSWVCGTPQLYDDALSRLEVGNKHALAQELFDAKQCIYMDDDNLEDMMAPFVTVLHRDGDMAKVTFIVEHYKRIAMLHRKFSRMAYTGWTAASNVTSYY